MASQQYVASFASTGMHVLFKMNCWGGWPQLVLAHEGEDGYVGCSPFVNILNSRMTASSLGRSFALFLGRSQCAPEDLMSTTYWMDANPYARKVWDAWPGDFKVMASGCVGEKMVIKEGLDLASTPVLGYVIDGMVDVSGWLCEVVGEMSRGSCPLTLWADAPGYPRRS